jgi:DUF4097 and DUF4098 domain-containing protein YvlB
MSEQTFQTPGPVRLEVRVPAGDLDVSTAEAGESRIVLSGSQKLIDSLSVDLVGDRLVVEQPRRLGLFGRLGGELKVEARIPAGSRVELAHASGDATLDGSFAALEMRTASGDVCLQGEISGAARIRTVSGNVRLARVGGDLDIQSVSGNVTAEAAGGSVSIRSVSGDARIGWVREGTAEFQSVSGDVELGVAPGTQVDLDAGSASGSLRSDVPLSSSPDGAPGPTLVIRSKTVSGDFRLFPAAAGM